MLFERMKRVAVLGVVVCMAPREVVAGHRRARASRGEHIGSFRRVRRAMSGLEGASCGYRRYLLACRPVPEQKRCPPFDCSWHAYRAHRHHISLATPHLHLHHSVCHSIQPLLRAASPRTRRSIVFLSTAPPPFTLDTVTPDLLAVAHPWTRAPRSVDALATTGELQYELCTSSCYLFIDAGTLRDLDGVVVVVPPVRFVVVSMTPPAITVDVIRVYLPTMPKCERFPANILCISVPPSAPRVGASPLSTFHVTDVEDGLGSPFELRRHRKGVPYRLGAAGHEHPSAAVSVLPRGVWACRVRLVRCELDSDAVIPEIAEQAESRTATVIMSRKGHRRAVLDRAVIAIYETVATAGEARSSSHQGRR